MKDGKTFSSVMLIKREIDREHNEIRDLMVLTDPRPNIPPMEINGIGKVTEGNRINYQCPAFTSEIDLIGEPWKWTSSKGTSILHDGKIGTGTTKFSKDSMLQQQELIDSNGEKETTYHEFKVVTASMWEKSRKWILGGDS